jgi:hypothetical protein
MTVDLEADLRSEFNAATPPSTLTFHPESIVRLGNRTIRRRRIIAVGSAAMAVALVATGASLLTRPHDTAAPQPATRTATSGIVQAKLGVSSGTFQVELNRDAKVVSNVKLSFVKKDGQRTEVGAWSTTKPGQRPDASWKSGMVDGHPFTVGLVPGTDPNITLADGASLTSPTSPDTINSAELKGTGYTAFAVLYKKSNGPEAAQPAQIASIRWTGPTGILDGIEGDHRLTGRILTIDRGASVEVLLRPGKGGRDTVFGRLLTQDLTKDGKVYSSPTVLVWTLRARPWSANEKPGDLVATTDPSGAAVVTGRRESPAHVDDQGQDKEVKVELMNDGTPVAAGVLPPGASNIGVVLTTNEAATGKAVSEPLPDGRVIFALEGRFGVADQPSSNSIKTIVWTNADGTKGRIAVTQSQFSTEFDQIPRYRELRANGLVAPGR